MNPNRAMSYGGSTRRYRITGLTRPKQKLSMFHERHRMSGSLLGSGQYRNAVASGRRQISDIDRSRRCCQHARSIHPHYVE